MARRRGSLRLRGRPRRRARCPRPRVNPRTGRVTKYLGHRVPDVGRPGLDRPSEYYGILREILRDYRAGCITRATARGRLLLLYRLAARLPPSSRRRVRSSIERALRRVS